MKTLLISLFLLMIAVPVLSAEKGKYNPDSPVSYLSLSRLGSFYISPFTLSMENKVDPHYLWGAGTSYRLGTHLAIQGRYTQTYNKVEVTNSYQQRAEAGLVIYF